MLKTESDTPSSASGERSAYDQFLAAGFLIRPVDDVEVLNLIRRKIATLAATELGDLAPEDLDLPEWLPHSSFSRHVQRRLARGIAQVQWY